MKHGSDWYKREPAAYLGGVQGLTSKEHAVYSVTLELIYAHGGSVNNDPGWISGWIKDMGQAAVRKAIESLCERGKLMIDGDQITQKRAKTEAKTKENVSETARENGRKGGKKSAEKRRAVKENNGLSEADASSENQADKIREEKSIEEESKASSSNARGAREEVDWFGKYLDAHPNPFEGTEGEARFNALIEAGEQPERIVAAAAAYRKATSGFSEQGRIQQADNFLDPERGKWREYLPREKPTRPSTEKIMETWAAKVREGRGFGLERQMAEALVAKGMVTQQQLNDARGYNG